VDCVILQIIQASYSTWKIKAKRIGWRQFSRNCFMNYGYLDYLWECKSKWFCFDSWKESLNQRVGEVFCASVIEAYVVQSWKFVYEWPFCLALFLLLFYKYQKSNQSLENIEKLAINQTGVISTVLTY